MDQKTKKIIQELSECIIQDYDINIPITECDSIIERFQGRVENVDSYWIHDIIKRVNEDNCNFVIFIPGNPSVQIRNFTLIQELGHILLHRGYMSDWERWENFDKKNQVGYSQMEFEAHEFAANFLMPKKEYLDFVYENKTNGTIDPTIIADYFHVTAQEAIARGKWLGVLSWV